MLKPTRKKSWNYDTKSSIFDEQILEKHIIFAWFDQHAHYAKTIVFLQENSVLKGFKGLKMHEKYKNK